jgi:adenine-specific DNA-methyltransferase
MSDEVAKVELDSLDLAAEKLAAFQDLFPGVIADGVLDAGRLGELLDTDVAAPADGRERFGLMWAGKQEAVRSLLAPSRGALLPEFDKSTNFDEAHHTFIEGDNLEVLKLLQKAYNDKIKLIYIDPPYNTGNDFVYVDDFRDGLRGYLGFTGQVDAEGNRVSAVADTAGRRHSRWLSMIYPRLVLARNLLTQDGALFVSIDDNESMNLRLVLDEVFGPENFRADIAWQKRYTRSNNTQDFTTVTEHILVYSRSVEFTVNLLPRTDEADGRYTNPDSDPRGPWKGASFLNPATPKQRPNLCYPITNPNTGQVAEPTTNAWRRSREEFERLQSEGLLYWGADGRSAVPSIKRFLSEARGLTPINFWEHGYAGNTDDGTRDLAALFETKVFENPKPVQLMKRVLEHATDSDSLVLDFFSGSGTLGEAVLRLNAEDDGQRRFILVQIPETTPATSVARESGFEKISDITRERVRRAMAAVDGAASAGLRSFSLSQSCFRDETTADPADLFDLRESTLDDGDHVMEELAGEVLLKEGVALDAKWTRGKADVAEVILAEGVAVVLSLEITETVASAALALKPRVLVFLEDGFAGRDAVKTNAFTNAKNLGITVKTV